MAVGVHVAVTLHMSSTFPGSDNGLLGGVDAGPCERRFQVFARAVGRGAAAKLAAVSALLSEDGDDGGASLGLAIEAFLGGANAVLDANVAQCVVVLDNGRGGLCRPLG